MHSWRGGGGRLFCGCTGNLESEARKQKVETLRETQEEVATGGLRVTKAFRGGVVLHTVYSVLVCSAVDTQLSSVRVIRKKSRIKGSYWGEEKKMRRCSKVTCQVQYF